MATFHLALMQLQISSIKSDNVTQACSFIREAATQGAKIVSLPECFNSPYGTKYFPEYTEKIPGESTQKFSKVAKECSIYLIGGSIPEEDAEKLYNTCAVFGPDGTLLANTVANPWREVLAKAGTEAAIVYSDIDLKKLAEIRQQIPIFRQKRPDLYAMEMKKP
ncbi:hypothetical protein H8959_009891 [Pygathrix nigripes]